MNSSRLKAVAVCREINLSKIASHFGIERKLSWEDTLALNEQRLSGILPQPADKSLFIFSFGSLAALGAGSSHSS
ncbi:MAG TPA: RMD1 family protein, partial [Bacillota bacterium]|nr:RMD1 family protein [Bacillota bacterium]